MLKPLNGTAQRLTILTPRQEESNDSKEVLLLVIYTLETQIMDCVYKN